MKRLPRAPSLLPCATVLLLLFATPARLGTFDAAPLARQHHITSKDNFVILDGEQAQLYRLLGVLPLLQTLTGQVVAVGIALTLAVIVAVLTTLLQNGGSTTHRARDILDRLPEPVARFLFYLYFEGAAYTSVLAEEVMTYVNAPVTLGLNLASRLARRSTSHHGMDDSIDSASASTPTRGGRRAASSLQKSSAVPKAPPSNAQSSTGKHYPGLWNTGNSCFLNSTLQSLASVDGIQTFLEHVLEEAERWDVPTPVTDALYDIILQLNTPSSSRTAIIPRQLTDALSRRPQSSVGSFFYAHQQQDAHELLVLITSALDDEMLCITREREAFQYAQSSGLRAVFAPAVHARPPPSPLNSPFRALVAQRTACLDCGYVEAVRHYPADELSLNVPPRAGSTTTIEACLASWSKLEVVDWVCFRCSLLRTLDRVRAESSVLAAAVEANASSKDGRTTPHSGSNGHATSGSSSASKKKKSGAKRRRMLEVVGKENVLMDILKRGYSEDEVEALQLLQQHGIKLDRTFSRAATKQVMLARTPRILLIHLNRSSYSASNFGASKNNAAVLFDEELNLGDVVTGGDLSVRGDQPISRGTTPSLNEAKDEPNWTVHGQGRKGKGRVEALSGNNGYLDHVGVSGSTMKTRYALCGIVVHYGGHSSGHYVAFRRRVARKRGSEAVQSDDANDVDGDEVEQNGTQGRSNGLFAAWSSAFGGGGDDSYVGLNSETWYRISDDSVSRCSLQDVMMQNPFLLFYERLGDDTAADERVAQASSLHVGNGVVNGGHQHTSNGVSDGQTNAQRGSHVPQGFESLARLQQVGNGKTFYKPRIIERWETGASIRSTGKQNGLHAAPQVSEERNGVTQTNGNGATAPLANGTHHDEGSDRPTNAA